MPSPIWAAIVVLSFAQWLGLLVVAVSGSKKPAETLTWVMICLVVPLLGVPLYFILTARVPKRLHLPWEHSSHQFSGVENSSEHDHGVELRQRNAWKMEAGLMGQLDIYQAESQQMHESLHMHTKRGSQTRRVIQFAIHHFSSRCIQAEIQTFHAGDKFYQAMLQDINRASYSIDVEFYIFRDDEVGRAIVQLLSEQARRGLKVRFLRDGLGSRKFPQSVVQQLQDSGVECRVFSPLRAPFLSRHLNHRDHCKIVIIDEKVGYTGGMNVGREYAGRDPKYGLWRDTSVRIASETRLPLLDLFEANFCVAEEECEHRSASGEKTRKGEDFKTAGSASVPSDMSMSSWAEEDNKILTKGKTNNARTLRGEVQFVQSGPDTKQNLRQLYFLCLTQAKHQVEIITPYFLPESDLIMALTTAVSRGVKVRLLLPEQVDHRIIGMACQTYFPALLDAGVEIYLYRPGVLHAKVMTVDCDVAIVGAANYDLRSFRLNYEVCLVQYGSAVTHHLRQQFEHDLVASRRLLENELRTSPIAKLKHRTARLAAPLC
ncbi:phospholipase D-like domain-containing protein [Alicyclobacillus ferrooxydans]|uniref:PLD phosphodiesterase domain-containing protein n=1 Tax=Alicyclobacillus ferrooxydans TaxID=471514 RepID=A0A0P9CA45_9BACL|nr:phospholipase D-like domain-containing protein [Alicyclobacillus ferrooxydans]KPV42159.1 hypothetical protein AN477_19145 [Alicyclobacillus ferrooxydans]